MQHSYVVERPLHFKLKSKTASQIVTQTSTILISPPPSWLPFVVVSLGNCPVSRKSHNTTKLFLRRILRRRINSYTDHQFEDKKPVQRYRSIIQHFFHSNWHLNPSDVLTDCSAIATAIATRAPGALAALLLLETITTHPQLRVSSTSSTPDGARAENGPRPRPPIPSSQRLRKPTPA